MTGSPKSNAFAKAYEMSVDRVLEHWRPEMQSDIARHCAGWLPAQFDFDTYLRASLPRFARAWRALSELSRESTICDVGSFWGVLPLTLVSLGYREITMTESLQFYSTAFDGLFEMIRGSGVTIVDIDPFESLDAPFGKFSAITSMAVLEHYPHSVKTFMVNMNLALIRDGNLYIEVPNIAYLPSRLALLRGHTPLVSAPEIWQSSVPFIGHHHEYTYDELRAIVELGGFEIVRTEFYNYSVGRPRVRDFVRQPARIVYETLFSIAPATRECIAVTCRPCSGDGV